MKTGITPVRYLCLLLLLPAQAPAASEPAQPALSAHYRYWHEPSDTLLDEARVTHSAIGLRVEQVMGDSSNVFIANLDEDAFWFLDRKRHLVHSIPVIVTSVDDADGVENDSQLAGGAESISGVTDGVTSEFADENGGENADEVAPEIPEGESIRTSALASIIQTRPCESLGRVKIGNAMFQGRSIQRWSCLFDGEAVEEHWYAETLGVVVRIETVDGFVSELTNVHKRHADSSYFRPPSHYRSVGIEELINPAVPISSYNEKVNGQL